MERKNKIIIWIVVILVVISTLFLLFSKSFLQGGYSGPELTQDKLITNQTLIDLIVKNNISPLGNNLSLLVLDEAESNIADDSWRKAYYVCDFNKINKNLTEHSGWIQDYNGKTGEIKLYGPYDWCLV